MFDYGMLVLGGANAVAGTPNVSINVYNDHLLTITVVNSELNDASAGQRESRMRQIATLR